MRNTAKTSGNRHFDLKEVNFHVLPKDYPSLCGVYLPRPLHKREEYLAAVQMVDALAGHDLSDEAEEYLDVVARFIEEYQEMTVPRVPVQSGLEILKFLMAENSMSQNQLAEVLQKDKSLVSKLLKGERELTVEHLRKLGAYFKVSPAVFVAP